jgi:hypothetical protein
LLLLLPEVQQVPEPLQVVQLELALAVQLVL